MRTTNLSFFGSIEIADGELVVMDGGIHGVQGHTLRLADGCAHWERRLDSMQQIGDAGSGTFALAPDERDQLRAWADQAWEVAESHRANLDPSGGPPRWLWAIVLRRGDRVRTLEGGSIAPTERAPRGCRELLSWMIAKIDALAGR